MNNSVKRIFNKVEAFYFEYRDKPNNNRMNKKLDLDKIERIKKDLDKFTEDVRKRFKGEWEKSKRAK